MKIEQSVFEISEKYLWNALLGKDINADVTRRATYTDYASRVPYLVFEMCAAVGNFPRCDTFKSILISTRKVRSFSNF